MNKDSIIVNEIKFKYNSKEQAYGKVIEVEGKNVLIVVYETYVKYNIEKCLEYASNYINNLDINKLKNIIVEEFYNKDKDSELHGVNLETFISSISLLTITVDNNYVEYWFDDAGFYGNHNLIISKKHLEEIYTIDIAGWKE